MQTYGEKYTGYHRHMISVVVFFYSNTIQSILVYYAVTDMDCFDDYPGAVPCAKIMRENDITTFVLQISLCITFNQKNVTGTLIA